MSIPKDLRYSNEHVWVNVEGNKVRIGITDYAQDDLGDIVFVDLPEVGDRFKADDSFGSVESVKTVSELYAPISGTTVEVNEKLEDQPELVNQSPYEKAWMIIVEPAEETEIEKLLNAQQYQTILDDKE